MKFPFEPKDYGYYIEQDFRYRWLRPRFLFEKLEKYKAYSPIRTEIIGRSLEGRQINALSWGNGPKRILCWSQMHGNEPTATMAIIDLLNFLAAADKYDSLRAYLNEQITICIIPMVNPDGAEFFSRRNAAGLDLNRDAVAQACPEMKVLIRQVETFKPDWAFNLHDQRNIFSAGNTGIPATISFLSASADESKAITEARQQSMKVIGMMAEMIEKILPAHIGRYTDEFYPRALGEYFHGRQIPCILIESGAHPEDDFRDVARKLNFLAMLNGFHAIASESYLEYDLSSYRVIPQNHTNIMDLIVKNCQLVYKNKTIQADLGFLYQEKPDFETGELNRHFVLHDLGDLSFHYGLREEQGGSVNLDQQPEIGNQANLVVKRENEPDLVFKNGILQ